MSRRSTWIPTMLLFITTKGVSSAILSGTKRRWWLMSKRSVWIPTMLLPITTRAIFLKNLEDQQQLGNVIKKRRNLAITARRQESTHVLFDALVKRIQD